VNKRWSGTGGLGFESSPGLLARVNLALRHMGPPPYELVLVGRIVLADGRSPLVEAYGVLDADCVELALN
jgi:hypothetical protein